MPAFPNGPYELIARVPRGGLSDYRRWHRTFRAAKRYADAAVRRGYDVRIVHHRSPDGYVDEYHQVHAEEYRQPLPWKDAR